MSWLQLLWIFWEYFNVQPDVTTVMKLNLPVWMVLPRNQDLGSSEEMFSISHSSECPTSSFSKYLEALSEDEKWRS